MLLFLFYKLRQLQVSESVQFSFFYTERTDTYFFRLHYMQIREDKQWPHTQLTNTSTVAALIQLQ